MSKRVSFIDTVHPVLRERLQLAGFDCLDHTNLSIEELKAMLAEVNGIVIRSRFRMDQELLQHAPNLQFIARSGAGMENIDEAYCLSKRIRLYNAPEGNRNAVAEHALGMLLMLLNKLHTADREVRQGMWDREGNRGIELEGKTVGIIGYGNNGEAFARKLVGFDVDVLAHDKYKLGFANPHVAEVSMDELLHRSDVISMHVPLTEETRYMVNTGFVASAGKPFILINLSRGKVVSTEALLQGIEEGKVLGACLDVLEYESSSFEQWLSPQHMHPVMQKLMQRTEVVFSPHVGGWTHQSYFKLSNVLADKILSDFG